MTERAYITVDRAESPRLVEIAEVVAGGSDAIGIQDLHDTLNSNTLSAGDSDDSLDNMDDDFLIDSAGKEDLGDGVLVGITATLQNAQIAFDGNYTPSQTGTATSADPLGRTLTDISATFEANNVKRGDWIVNFTDKSVTEVLSVISETVLIHRSLKSGSANDWEIGDEYSIFAIIQKEVSGGNLVAIDDVGDQISSIFTSFATQVVRTASSSATLQEQADVQYASFNGGVTVDVTSPYGGTIFPVGTLRQPVNNLDDAVDIAIERGFTTLFIIGDVTFEASTGSELHGFSFVGESCHKTLITIEDGADVTHSEFSNASVEGILDGGNVITDCQIYDLQFLEGLITRCILNGIVTLSTHGHAEVNFIDCSSGVPDTPVIDFINSNVPFGMRNYNGKIILRNKNGAADVGIDLNSGDVVIEDTVDVGTVTLRGVGIWANKSAYAGGATVVDQLLSADNIVSTLDENTYDGKTFSNLLQDLLSMANGRIVESPTGTYVFYEQDNTTPRFTLVKAGNVRSRA